MLVRADVTCDGQQIAATDRVPFSAMLRGSAKIRLFFEITGYGAVVETRVRTGGGAFAVCSLNVKPIASIKWLVRARAAAIAERLRQQCAAHGAPVWQKLDQTRARPERDNQGPFTAQRPARWPSIPPAILAHCRRRERANRRGAKASRRTKSWGR